MAFIVEDGNTKKAIMKSSKKNYLVIAANKFHKDGVYKFADIYEVDSIVVNQEPEPKISDMLSQLNISTL